jgi:hypothetical protein
MSIVLMLVGALTAAAGAVMLGFGIPINEFSLGNTLIMSGTTALAGGLIVFALGAVLRQLNRVGELLAGQRAVPRPPVPGEAPAAAARPAMPPRMPLPLRPQPEMAEREPTRPAPARSEPALRPPFFAPGGAPVTAEAEEVPLSPGPAPRAVRPEPAAEGERPAPHAPEITSVFDRLWPDTARRREPEAAKPAAPPAHAPHPSPPAAVSILKSGIVDGMAYTLYTDGSIEAELEHGVVRFGSIEELRKHLEKQGG